MRSFLRDDRGGAAAEFALIAPVMTGALLAMFTVGQSVYDRMDMLGAVRSGIQYWMNGGRDMAVVTQIVEMSWGGRPRNGTVTPVQIFMCGEVEIVSGQTCSGGAPPMVYLRITVSGTYSWAGFEETVTMSEQTRVR